MRRILLLLFIASLGCSGADEAQKPDAPVVQPGGDKTGPITSIDDYPTFTGSDGKTYLQAPFSAAEIRDGTPNGLTQFVQFYRNGQRSLVQVQFSDADQDGVELSNTFIDGNGDPISETVTERVTWKELESHGYFEAAVTTVGESSVTTPLGTFDAVVFITTETAEGKEMVTRTYFARALPGAPVYIEQTIDGEPQMSLELVGRNEVK